MHTIDTVVLDLDGTLLNSNHKISPKTKDTLLKLQQHGITVILASGRPTTGMIPFAKELKLNEYGGYMISFNGACVIECATQEIIHSEPLSVDQCKPLLAHLSKYDIIPMISNETHLFVHDAYNAYIDFNFNAHDKTERINIVEFEARGCNFKVCEVHNLSDFIDFPAYKVLIAGEADYLKEHIDSITSPFKDSMSCAFSAPFYFEFTNKGVDKANTLKITLDHLNKSYENVIAFGDSYNDISMLKVAGLSVAMANAKDEIKEAADEITASNDEDGIALKLHSIFPEYL